MFEQLQPFQLERFKGIQSATAKTETLYNPTQSMILPDWLTTLDTLPMIA
jgi:hypothetical protein